ncbi:MAG: MaoC family dehydratase N-terminal domain-containing protein [Myxococcaceae bacterium]|nr:MaoC family dehydratase N-terminal domain-containing protein [Myxococcaceae bacterium]
MPPRKLYFENVRVGDELPPLSKPAIDRVQIARYASAVGDFSPIHVDEAYAKTLSMPSVVAPAGLGMGFLGQLVTDWARGATLRKLSVRFVKLLWPGDTLVCKGRVSDRHGQDGKYIVELDVWAENSKGELALRGSCALQVFYSAEDETRQRNGQGPVVVNVARESILAEPDTKKAAARTAGEKTGKGQKLAAKAAPKKPAKPAKPAKKKR